MTYDLTKLRLEIEVPTEGAPNIVRNPSGEKGTSGWETPLTNQTLLASFDGTTDSYYLRFRSNAAGPARLETSMLPAIPGKFYSARYNMYYQISNETRTRLEFYDANRTLLSQGNQSTAQNAVGTYYVPSAQAPVNTAYVKLRFDYYISGTNPPTSSFFAYHNQVMVTYADSFVGLSSSRTNLMPNPSFETGVANWTNRRLDESTLTRSATQASVGTYSGRILNTHPSNPFLSVAMSTNMPVNGNRTYAFGLRIYSATKSRRYTFYVEWKKADGSSAGYDEKNFKSSLLGNGPYTGVGQWLQVSQTAVAPSDARFATVRLDFGTGTGSINDNLDQNEAFYIDAVQFEEGDSLPNYFDGSFANASGLTHAWTGTAHASASTRKTTGDGFDYTPPSDWANILGPTSNIKIETEVMDRGSLTAMIQDAMLDPAVSTTIRPGKAIRLQTYVDDHWETRFEGKVSNASTVYNKEKRVGAMLETAITLSANDCLTDLANQKESRVVPDIRNTAAILEGKGVMYDVNGSTGQLATPTIVAYNENSTTVDQLAVARDSVLGYVWIDRNNVVKAYDKNRMSSTVSRAFANGDYTDISVDFNMAACINQVNIRYLRYDIGSGTTTEIPYGPWVNSTSIAEWGNYESSFTVAAVTENPAALATLGQQILNANSVPKVRCNSITFVVKNAATMLDAATLDLYDLVSVQTDNLSESYRVTGMSSEITPERWQVTLTFDTPDSVAAPTVVPAPPFTGISIGSAQAGFVQMFAGSSAAIPQGWLLCDGSTFNQSTYPKLYAVLGNSNTLPDLRGRMPIGAGTFTGVRGSDSVAEADRTPQHAHGMGPYSLNVSTATNTQTGGANTRVTNVTASGTTGTTGRNAQPYYGLHFIIKA